MVFLEGGSKGKIEEARFVNNIENSTRRESYE